MIAGRAMPTLIEALGVPLLVTITDVLPGTTS